MFNKRAISNCLFSPLLLQAPGSVYNLWQPSAGVIGGPAGAWVPGEVGRGLLEVVLAGEVVEEGGVLPAQEGQPLLVTHVAQVLGVQLVTEVLLAQTSS